MQKKKWLSALLAVTMVIAMIPMTVFAVGTECTNGDACTEHAAAIGNVHYTTLQEAVDEATSGAEIKLLKDENTVAGVTFKKEGTYTLDLNGKILSTNSNDIISLKTPDLALTIKNGNLSGPNAGTYGIYAYNGGGTAPTGDYANLNLTLDGVNLSSATQPMGVQGMNSNQNVTIKNSVITSPDVGIYFPPKSGTLTIDNSQINGVTNGIVVKGGELVVTGEDTVIRASGPKKPQDKPYTGAAGGGGFPETGDAIYVEGGYNDRPIDVVVEDGKIESVNADAVAVNHVEIPDEQKAAVEGGIFSSDVTEFVAEGQSSVGVVSDGETTYYIGTPEAVAEKIAEVVKAGDTVTVTKGDAALTDLPDGVTVKNDGDGDVSVNGDAVTDTPVVSHTHTWGAPVWSWNADKTEATATFTCTADESHVGTVTAAATKETMPATCGKAGKTVYTVSVEFNGETYTDTKTVEISATGHGETEIKNAKDATCTEEGYTGDKVCKDCGEVVEQGKAIAKIAHTYKDGKCTVCGATDPDYKPEENKPSDIPQTGDTSNLWFFALLMVLSAGGVASSLIFKRSKASR